MRPAFAARVGANEWEHLRAIMRQFPGPVVVAEAATGRIAFVNEWAAAALDGDLQSQLAGSGTPSRILRADGSPYQIEELPIVRAIAAGETVIAEELVVVASDGKRGVLQVHAGPIRDPDGAVVAAVATFVDVTERTRQEQAQRFLAEAGRVLASSLDYEETLARVARLAVPDVADWCSIELLEAGRIRNVAVAHADPQKRDLARELRRRYPVRDDAEGGAAKVIRTAASELVPVVTDEMIARAARDEEHLRILRALGLQSAVVAPLVARGRTLGAVTFVSAESGRSYDESDLALLEELGRRVALAVDNARLFAEQASSRESAESLAGRLQRVQQIVDATLAPASLDELLPALLERLQDVLGTDSATILIRTEEEEQDALVIRASLGLPDAVRGVRVPLSSALGGTIFEQHVPWTIDDVSDADVFTPILRGSGTTSLAGVPLVVEGRPIGVLHVGTRQARSFSEDDVQLLRLVASRAAVAIERTRMHEREHRIAETLQRSLLPETLPESAATRVAARYISGSASVEVGGDWYDVFELEDGRLGLAVGDVVGRGMRAAAAMGKLRNALRAYALEGLSPAAVLWRVNRTAMRGEELFATAVYIVLDPVAGAACISSAGHLPPLVRTPDGAVLSLEGGRSLPVGAVPEAVFEEETVDIPPGSTLLLYTDGLVERRDVGLEERIAQLRAAFAAAPTEPEAALDHLLDRMGASARQRDDVAAVAIELVPRGAERLAMRLPASAESLEPLRETLGRWLDRNGIEREEAFDVLVAAGEACANAVEHPLGASEDHIDLAAELEDGELVVSVRDTGGWRPARARTDRGRGIGFMQALMENVDIAPSRSGTEVRMRRRVGGRR